jgi:hypothetical protein
VRGDTVVVTDPHHEFFGRSCVLMPQAKGSEIWVRPLYGTDVLSIREDQFEKVRA